MTATCGSCTARPWRGTCRSSGCQPLTPAKAGVRLRPLERCRPVGDLAWVPAFAGMSGVRGGRQSSSSAQTMKATSPFVPITPPSKVTLEMA